MNFNAVYKDDYIELLEEKNSLQKIYIQKVTDIKWIECKREKVLVVSTKSGLVVRGNRNR